MSRTRGGSIIRFATLSVGAALALSACSGGSEPSTDGPLTSAELGWIRAESAWAIAIYDEELGPPPGARLVEECKQRLAEVGEPPTDRIRPALEQASKACPPLDARGSFHRAEDALQAADDIMRPLLRAEQDIVLSDARTSTSRADLTLSARASTLADDVVEVRCWSSAEWRRVVGEKNAWNDASDAPDELYGYADTSDSEIHMRIAQCNTLRRLVREDVLGWSRADQIEAANSLDTFAHEIQHQISPDADEAEAECGAGRALVPAARRLGATPAEAAHLAALYRSDIYPDLDSEYQSDECPE